MFMDLIILVNFSQIPQSKISLVELTIFTNLSQILHSTMGLADLTILRNFHYWMHFWTHLNLRWSSFFYFFWNSSFQIITELAPLCLRATPSCRYDILPQLVYK